MSIPFSCFLLFFTIITIFLATLTKSASPPVLHPDELNALKEIATTLGIKGLDLKSENPCIREKLKFDFVQNEGVNNTVKCHCDNMTCHIIDLFLKSMDLPGKLPPQLVKLSVSPVDRLVPKLPFRLNPDGVGFNARPHFHVSYLSFSLCANNLSGPLPSGFQNFKNLTFLSVEANQFSGLIPDELGNLTNLTGLELASNKFTGSLPSTLARLIYLEKVTSEPQPAVRLEEPIRTDVDYGVGTEQMVNDHFRGEDLPNAQARRFYDMLDAGKQPFSLSANNLSGPLPTGLQYFKSLTSLYVSYLGVEANQFSGPIPDELGNLTNLIVLELASNQFTGRLPSSLARLVNLEKFRISDNNFSGIIPEYIGNWSQLKRL
ncbi:hypothetical protein F2Q70_00012725 [Brassica cretica]|uniref:Leucine-rich repeat-containing N-terminal plant-type domain-containing protein n=1 Tax=Brassica cretica TaxID=69181 RepID=A0A8S9LWP8_BRACR|nr:hypothetical protein F2Q70_00012725 [Brassica cretica]